MDWYRRGRDKWDRLQGFQPKLTPSTSRWSVDNPGLPPVCRAKGKVFLPSTIDYRIRALTKHMDGLEWLGYLTGKVKDAEATVTGLIIPKQKVTPTSVTEIAPVQNTSIIGTVHSHARMGSFFSGTDTRYVVANHHVALVVNEKGGYKAALRIKAPCKVWLVLDADVKITHRYIDLTSFLKKAEEQMGREPVKEYVPGLEDILGFEDWQYGPADW